MEILEKNISDISERTHAYHILITWKKSKKHLINEIINFLGRHNEINTTSFNPDILNSIGIPACKICLVD